MPAPPAPPLSAERRQLRSAKAIAVRQGRTEDAARLDTEIRAARLAAAITETIDVAPALTAEQRLKLAGLLAGPVAR